ncbi:hypothetical protein DDZ16_06765 [Marinilabilia rubra]|uniref:Uncharacterized protein n=1 Tax=Marinilabilia rubra TaxID=2162893 RepID=A0A2U2BAK2_9BACT|nr:hypothetical protein DDZ16_06765 [Marinilabilia rubra]
MPGMTLKQEIGNKPVFLVNKHRNAFCIRRVLRHFYFEDIHIKRPGHFIDRVFFCAILFGNTIFKPS